jgi:sec-independent protein translocase protein TatA
MFDNPEKLFILLVIALLIFGPSKLATLGGTIGKTIREFRSAVRGAHETFTSEMHQAVSESEPHTALPAPDAFISPSPAIDEPQGADLPQHEPLVGEPAASPFDSDQSSLASEPSGEAVRKSLAGRG